MLAPSPFQERSDCMADSENAHNEQEASSDNGKPTGNVRIAAIAIAVAVVVLAAGIGIGFAIHGSQQPEPIAAQEQQQPADNQNASDNSQASQDVHKHDWVAEYETVHHDAETHVVHHDAVYENQTVYSTMCNTCGKYFDPDTNDGTDHLRETGHKGLTKQVPHKETVKVKEAWDEPVTDKAAYDESVLKDYKCSTCGVVASPEDVQKDSANQPTEA